MKKCVKVFLWILIILIAFAFGGWIGEKIKASDKLQIIDCIPFKPVDSIIFGDDVGRLSWADGKMSFEGDTYESARLFFEYLKGYIDSYIDSEMEKGKPDKTILYPQDGYYKPGILDDTLDYKQPWTQDEIKDWQETLITLDTEEEPEEILFEFTTGGVLKDDFKPQLFLKITNTDLSRCFIDGRLKVDLNGEIYWIRLEK